MVKVRTLPEGAKNKLKASSKILKLYLNIRKYTTDTIFFCDADYIFDACEECLKGAAYYKGAAIKLLNSEAAHSTLFLLWKLFCGICQSVYSNTSVLVYICMLIN